MQGSGTCIKWKKKTQSIQQSECKIITSAKATAGTGSRSIFVATRE